MAPLRPDKRNRDFAEAGNADIKDYKKLKVVHS